MIGQMALFVPDEKLPLRQRVQVEIVPLFQVRKILEKFHYLHRARVGRQINYSVIIDGVVDGVITFAYPMMNQPINGVPSDEVIEFARMYLHHNIPHTATCAIGKTLKRVKRDWMTLFPDSKTPKLVVSWSDTTRHKGTIYKAANFQWLKKSKGGQPANYKNCKRGIRKKYDDYLHEKDCWIYIL